MDFYITMARRYAEADADTRRRSREHWARCNKENIEAGRPDLVCFSSKMLGMFAGVEAIEAQRAGEADR